MTPTCERVLEQLPHGPLAPELERHLQGCAHCRASKEAFELLGNVRSPQQAPPGLAPSLRAELAAAPRARPWWWEALGAVMVLLVTAFGILFAVGVRSPGGMPLMGWFTAACLLLLIALGGFSAFSPRGERLRQLAVALATVAAIAVVAGATGEGAERPFWKAGLPCLGTELGATLPLMALLTWMLTRSAPNALKALAAGLAGGAAGVFALHLHCPVSTVSHLLVFHALPWLVLAGVAVAVRRWVSSRSYAP